MVCILDCSSFTGDKESQGLAASTLANITFAYSTGAARRYPPGAVQVGQAKNGCTTIDLPGKGTVQFSLVQERYQSKLLVKGEISEVCTEICVALCWKWIVGMQR